MDRTTANAKGGIRFRLTRNRLFDEICMYDPVCPERHADGTLKLVAQEEDTDVDIQGTSVQTVGFDEKTQYVVWETTVREWRIKDIQKAYAIAMDWMIKHPRDAIVVDPESGSMIWRRTFWTGWVDDADDLELLANEYLYDSMSGGVSFFAALQRSLA